MAPRPDPVRQPVAYEAWLRARLKAVVLRRGGGWDEGKPRRRRNKSA